MLDEQGVSLDLGLGGIFTAQVGILAATPAQASWATAPATRPRVRMMETDFILIESRCRVLL